MSLIGYVRIFTKILELLLKRNFPRNLHEVFRFYEVNTTENSESLPDDIKDKFGCGNCSYLSHSPKANVR